MEDANSRPACLVSGIGGDGVGAHAARADLFGRIGT